MTCGLCSIGSGEVADCHAMEFRNGLVRPPSSTVISIDGNGVSCPIALAAIWSADSPNTGRGFSSGLAPVRNTADELEWFAAAEASAPYAIGAYVLLMMLMWSRNGSSGFKIGVNSKPAPSVTGTHLSIVTPWGK